jgi:hypothetical protein
MSNTTMSGFSWPSTQNTITVRHEPSPLPSQTPISGAKNNHVFLAIGLVAAATVLVVLFSAGFVVVKRQCRRKAKGKGRAPAPEDGRIEMVDREAQQPAPSAAPSAPASSAPSPYREHDTDFPDGDIGSSRRSRAPSSYRADSCGPSSPKSTYASPSHRYPTDDIDLAVRYSMVVRNGKREFVEVPLSFAKVERKVTRGKSVQREKVWWGD